MTLGKQILQIFFKYALSIILFFCLLIGKSVALEMVETTGRAVITDLIEINNARSLALEEALYLAALHGGAKIDGFSAIATDSKLSENFVVRPVSNIVDYTIVNEEEIGDHYSVTIMAAVGTVENVSCNIGSIINLINYKPILSIASNLPAWVQFTAREIYLDLLEEFAETPNLNFVQADNETLNIGKLNSIDDNFDYTSLTLGRTRVNTGGYGLLIELDFKGEKVFEQDLIASTNDYVIMNLKSSIFQGENYNLIHTQEDMIKVSFKQSGISKLINILSKPGKDTIASKLQELVPSHVKAVGSTLSCRPLMAKLALEGDDLSIKIGKNHGVEFSSLAVTEGNTTPWTLLRIKELGNDYAILETFDRSKDLRQMNGLNIKFLEEM